MQANDINMQDSSTATSNSPSVELIKLPLSATLPEKHPRRPAPLQNSSSAGTLSPNTLFVPMLSKQAKLQLIGNERRKSFTEIQFDDSARVVRVPSPAGTC
jgi:hypothetical protein